MSITRPASLSLITLVFVLLAGCGGDSTTPEEHIANARGYLAMAKVNAGIIELKNALKKDPKNGEARHLLGKTYLLTHDGASALKELKVARELGISGAEFSHQLMQAYILEKDFIAAEALFKETPDTDRNDEMKLSLAQVYLFQEKHAPAAKLFSASYPDSKNQSTALMGLAELALTENKPELALDHINKALQLWPANTLAWRRKGEIQLFQNHPNAAEQSFTTAIEHASRFQKSSIQVALASAQIAQNKLDDAEKTIKSLNGRIKKTPEVIYLNALIAVKSDQPDAAEPLLQTVINKQEGNAAARLLLAKIKYDQGWMNAAESLVREALGINHFNVPGIKLLANILIKRGESREALALLNQIPAELTDYQVLALKGNAYLAAGQNDKAIASFESASASAPEESSLKTSIAYSQLNAGNTSDAISQLQSIIKLDGDNIQADILLIQTYIKSRDYEKAIATAKSLVQQQPNNPTAVSLLGSAYEKSGDPEKARQAFNDALRINGEFIPAILSLADLEIKSGDSAAASKRLEQANDEIPDNTTLLMALANLSLLKNDPASASRYLEQIRRADKNTLEPRLILSEVYLRTGNSTPLPALLDEILNINANDPRSKLAAANIYNQLGKPEKSMPLLKDLTINNPDLIQPYLNLAHLQLRSNQQAEARKNFETALTLSEGKNPDALFSLGRIALTEQRPADAGKLAAALKREHPGLATADALLGDIKFLEKQYATAAEHYRQSLELQKSTDAVVRLAKAYHANKQTQKAIDTLTSWLHEYPQDMAAHLSLADFYQQQKDNLLAIKEYELIIDTLPENVTALNNLAWLYLQEGNTNALKMANRALKLAPRHPDILDTAGWINYKHGNKEIARKLLLQAADLAPDKADIKQHLTTVLSDQ